MVFAGSKVGVGFIAVLSFVCIFVLIASAVWSNNRKDNTRKKLPWEQNEPAAKDQLQIILIVAAVLLVCIILAACGIN